jgi:ABC-type polysaccharide/polyol phosphate export permease
MTPQYAIGFRDFAEGIGNWRMWGRLGWAEVKRRYRRTTIGPFWTTLSLSIFVIALGIVWSTLWKAPITEYLPFLCAGLIAWNFVSTTILESCATFSTHEPLIKQIQFPYSILTCAVVWRNFIVFLHNLVVLVAVSAVCQLPPTL